jgi:GNAT superfamily N-acetyltransferase
MEHRKAPTQIALVSLETALKIRQHVMWPNKPLDFVKVEGDEAGLHYALLLNGKPISVVSLFYGSDDMQFRKFATLPNHQGKGYGTRLLTHIMCEAHEKGVGRIWCNARISKAGFYKKFGLAETTQTFTKDGIGFVVMERWLYTNKSTD